MTLQKREIGGEMRRLSWDEEAQGSFRDRGKMHGLRSHTHVTFLQSVLSFCYLCYKLGSMFQKMLKF